jgi:hypothetical protein
MGAPVTRASLALPTPAEPGRTWVRVSTGVGKTTLTIAAADAALQQVRFGGAVLFVELRGYDDHPVFLEAGLALGNRSGIGRLRADLADCVGHDDVHSSLLPKEVALYFARLLHQWARCRYSGRTLN